MKKFLKIILIIFVIVILLFLATNRCFFFTTYRDGEKEIFVPRFCFLYKESGLTVLTFYSLRSQNSLQKEIDEYLSTFEKRNNSYVKDNIYISSYNVYELGIYRRINLVYDPLYEQ